MFDTYRHALAETFEGVRLIRRKRTSKPVSGAISSWPSPTSSGHLVLTTGNKSEMSVGYATLYGDMAGGFAVIKDVPKTMVYGLARLRNLRGTTR